MEEKIVYEEREKKAGSGALALILIINKQHNTGYL